MSTTLAFYSSTFTAAHTPTDDDAADAPGEELSETAEESDVEEDEVAAL